MITVQTEEVELSNPPIAHYVLKGALITLGAMLAHYGASLFPEVLLGRLLGLSALGAFVLAYSTVDVRGLSCRRE